MLLLVEKQLSEATAESIRACKKKIFCVNNLLDPLYLIKDLVAGGSFDTKNNKVLYDNYAYFNYINLLEEAFPLLSLPKYDLALHKKSAFTIGREYIEREAITVEEVDKQKLYFSLSLREEKDKVTANNTLALSLRLVRNDGPGTKIFQLDRLGPNHYYYKEPDNSGFYTNTLFAFVKSFYNKERIYTQIKEILLKHKEKLNNNLGEVFTADLLALFSVKVEQQALTNFAIPKKTLSRKLYFEEKAIHEELAKTKELICYSCDNEAIIASSEIYLAKNNLMTICLNLNEKLVKEKFPGLNEKDLARIKKAPEIEAFLDEGVKRWLKDIKKLELFQTGFYKQMEAKTLLNNL